MRPLRARALWSVVTPLSVIRIAREIPGLARNNFHAPAPPSTKRSAHPIYSWGRNVVSLSKCPLSYLCLEASDIAHILGRYRKQNHLFPWTWTRALR